MFKSLPWLVTLSLIAAPMLPAHADPVHPSPLGNPLIARPFGYSPRFGQPYPRGIRPRGNVVIIQKSPKRFHDPFYSPRIGSPFYRSPVIVNPGFGKVIVPRRIAPFRTQRCGTTIYGSPIVSPIPVNPHTGLACR